MPSVLHVGCGGDPLPGWLSMFEETRLDIDPAHAPDIVASMTDMGDIGPFDRIYCAHALEHLAPHDVAVALSEFHRVLKPGGAALVFVPDVEDVMPTDDVLFVAQAGPITGHDLYYGHARLTRENPFMAHKTAFVQATLAEALEAAGFDRTRVDRMGSYNLFGVGVRDE